jgi:hypothetical protein
VTEFQPLYLPAVLLGAVLVGFSAFWDFHLPYRPQTLRYAVAYRRYILAAAVYIGANIFLYLITAGIAQTLLTLLHKPTGVFGLDDEHPHGIRQTSLVFSMLLVVALPYLPFTRELFSPLRRFAHAIALYPKSVQLLMTILSTAPFTARADAREQLEEELQRYSVSEGTLRGTISASAVRLMDEAWSLRNCFSELAGKGRSYKRFLEARASAINKPEVELQKVLSRTAKALLSLNVQERKQLRVVSQFVAEDCDAIVMQYRTLLAEAAMSCVPGPAGRENLIQSFGYTVSLPQMLPYLPLAMAFGLDFVLLLWPLILSPWIAVNTPFPKTNMFLFAMVHAISQTAAIAWAICPKAVYEFARPSLGKLPMPSYAVFGALSFLTGALVWTGLRFLIKPIPGMPLAEHPISFILINSLSFLFMTVCMSVLIDIRLRSRSYDYQSHRWRDAFALALTLVAAAVLFQAVFLPYMPPEMRAGWLPAIYLGLTFTLGFLLGYLVPSVATAYLQADELIARQIPTEADFLAQIKRRKSIGATALYPQRGAVAGS